MGTMASRITSLTIIYSTICSGADHRKHQSFVSLAFVWGIQWWPVNSPHKWPLTWKCFHLMTSSSACQSSVLTTSLLKISLDLTYLWMKIAGIILNAINRCLIEIALLCYFCAFHNALKFPWQVLTTYEQGRTWWRHQMGTFSALLALCVGNSLVTGEFPSQRPVTRSFDVFFDLRLNKQLSKQSRCRWSVWYKTKFGSQNFGYQNW